MEYLSYTGEKCLLRPLKKEDATISVHWRNQANIRERVMGYRFPVTAEMEAQWYNNALNHQQKNQLYFAIESINDKKLLGFVMLNSIDWIARTAELGIVIGTTNLQHQGIGTEAVTLFLNHAFKVFNLRKICIKVADYNKSAFSFWQKLSFKTEGCLKEQLFLGNQYHDVHLMAIFQKDWKE